MSILDLQRTIAEAGRIRIGHQVPTGNGRTRPEKLGTFRLTSPDRRRIEEAARLFGGEVAPWEAPAGPQWEVITKTAEINVIVPPSAMAFSQHYELWTAGGCARRCDGSTEIISDQACLCDPADRECEIHTRLSVMIRDLPGLALWRIDTQGWYAARELAGAVEIMALAAGRGILLPARLLVEQRSVKRIDAKGKTQTLRFPVPRLDPGITPGELLAGQGNGLSLAAAAESRPLLTPVPLVEGPRPTVAEQSAPPPARPPRRNAAPAIPPSGRQRARPGKQPGDDGYWRARVFADGAERGLDSDRIRLIAVAATEAGPDGFSMSTLEEEDWERVHRVVLGFPLPVSDGPGVVDDAEAAAMSAPDGNVATAPAAGADGMTREELVAALEEVGVDQHTALARSFELFPRPETQPLTDVQRAALVEQLRREAPMPAAAL